MIDIQAKLSASTGLNRPPSFGMEARAGWSSGTIAPMGLSFDALMGDQLGGSGLASDEPASPSARRAPAPARTEAPAPPKASAGNEEASSANGPQTPSADAEASDEPEGPSPGAPPTDPALWAPWVRSALPQAEKAKASGDGLGQEVQALAHEQGLRAGLPLEQPRALGLQVKVASEPAGTELGVDPALSEIPVGGGTETADGVGGPGGREWASTLSALQEATSAKASEAPTEALAGLETASLAELNATQGPDAGQRPELAPFQDRLAEAMEGPLFRPALGTKISVLVKDGIEQAKLQLNPAEMGPVAIRLARDGQRVRVDFAADLALTRQTLEQAMPALAVALKEAGFTLSGGSVTAPQDTSSGLNAGHSGQQHQAQADPHGSRDPKGAAPAPWRPESQTTGTEAASSPLTESPARPRSLGQVDLFA